MDLKAAYREPRKSAPAASLTTVWGAAIELDPVAILRRTPSTQRISADHLVFLLPSALAGHAYGDACTAARAAKAIEAALSARIALIARLLARQLKSMSVAPPSASTIIAALELTQIIDAASASSARQLLHHDGANRRTARPLMPISDKASLSGFADELAVVSCLATAAGRTTPATELIEMTFGDALVTSIHARVNAAYVIPAFDFAHEMLTTASWIGQVFSGRPAMMPVMVAECIIDALPDIDTAGSAYHGQSYSPESTLGWHAAACCNLNELVATAKAVAEKRAPQIVHPQEDRKPAGRPPVVNAQRVELASNILDDLLRTVN